MEHIKLSEKDTGLNYNNHTYMVAGWLSDYKLTYDKTEDGILTVNDFKENKGYVDEEGYVHIFREIPNSHETIPWFTIVMDDDGKPTLSFNRRRTEETCNAFRIERVGNMSLEHMVKDTKEGEVEYDPDVLNDIQRATSTFVPDIKHTDDFLKKLIKTVILEKGVNVHKYKKQMEKTYQLSNLIQGLTNGTKTSPIVFETWMEILNSDFEIHIKDAGVDKQDPLPREVIYKSCTGEISIKGGDEDEETSSHMPRSARQYN